jgi:plastocyanin
MKGISSIIAIGVCCWLALPQPEEQEDIVTGSIEGVVMLASQQSQVSMSGGNRYGRPSQTNKSSAQSPEDSVLIWLVSSGDQQVDLPETPVVLDQEDLKFNPSLLAIRQHGTIRIRNSDPVYHNVFSLSSTKKFDVGRRPQGEYKDETFDKPGKVEVFCDIHSNMHAVIYVMAPDVLTWTKAKGGESFILSNIPEGSYELKFYALGYEERSIPVEVTSEETESVGTITLTS